MDTYWGRLGRTGNPERDMLAQARIRPLYTNGDPIFVQDMFNMMSTPGAKAGQGIKVQMFPVPEDIEVDA